MHTHHSEIDSYENISVPNRFLRFSLSLIVIVFTMANPPSIIGWLAILHAIGILITMTAINGWDPILAFVHYFSDKKLEHHDHRIHHDTDLTHAI